MAYSTSANNFLPERAYTIHCLFVFACSATKVPKLKRNKQQGKARAQGSTYKAAPVNALFSRANKAQAHYLTGRFSNAANLQMNTQFAIAGH